MSVTATPDSAFMACLLSAWLVVGPARDKLQEVQHQLSAYMPQN